jgi:hypothetical protein
VTEDRRLDFLRVLDGKDPLRRLQDAAVADLAARLGIERRFVEDDDTDFAFAELFDRTAVAVEREYLAAELERLVAMEMGHRAAVVERRRHPELAGSARLFLLQRHRGVEGGDIDADPALAADIGREVEREAEGVVQLESRLALEDTVARQRREFAFEDAHAVLDGLEEAYLFLPQHLGDARLLADEFGIRGAHFEHQVGQHAVEEGARAPSL